MLRILFLFGLGISVFSARSQNFNRPVPASYPAFEFVQNDTSFSEAYYLVAPYVHPSSSNTMAQHAMYILDKDGYVVWLTQHSKKFFDFKYHPNFGRYSFTRRSQGIRKHYEMNEQLEIVDSTITANGVTGDIHEFQIFPNGNRCILGTRPHFNIDLSGYTFYNGDAGLPNTTVVSAVVQEFDPNGNLVFEWDSFNHLSPDYFASGPYNSNNFDYVHANAITLDPSDNNLILSLKTADLVCKIDHTTGDLIWRLNGNFSDFTYPNDGGFRGQHDARVLPNGNISIFDNDYYNDNPRGVEYSLDTNTMEATKLAEWPYHFNFYTGSLGSYQKTEDNYHMIGWGNTRRPAPSATLFDSLGNIATDIFFEDTVVTYRAFHQSLPNFPDRPSIQCEMIGNNLQLSVSGTHASFLWSTGEQTASIIVTQADEYQCWVNFGDGMLGSYPIVVDNSISCASNSLIDLDANPTEIEGIYDLMGRKIESPIPGRMYLVRSTDGSSSIHITPF